MHGLLDADVAGKPRFAEVAGALLDFIGTAVVVGHSINFELAVLRNEAHRHGVAWKEPRWLDVCCVGRFVPVSKVEPNA